MQRPRGAILALIAAQFAFASLAPTGKLVVNEMPPITAAGIRVFFAGLFLVAIGLSVARERVAWRDWPRLASFALLGVILNMILFLEGVQRTTSTNAVILIATIPIFALFWGIVLGREAPTRRRMLGIGVGVLGVAVLLRIEDFQLASQTTVGNMLVVLNCLSYSAFLVLSRPLLQRYRSTTAIMHTFLLAGVVMVPLAAWKGAGVDWTSISATAWAALASMILIGSVASYSLNNVALKRLDASLVASFVFLQPTIGVLLSMLLLAERPGLREVAGGALIVAGLFILARVEPHRVPATDIAPPPEQAATDKTNGPDGPLP